MTGALGYGASNIPEPRVITRGVSNISINDRSKIPDRQNTLSRSSTKQASSRSDGLSVHPIQHGEAFSRLGNSNTTVLILNLRQASLLIRRAPMTPTTFSTPPASQPLPLPTATSRSSQLSAAIMRRAQLQLHRALLPTFTVLLSTTQYPAM